MIQTPIVSLKRSSTPMPYSAGNPTLNCAGGSLMTLGNMKRPVAARAATEAAVKAPQATPSQVRRDINGDVSSSSAAAAATGFFAGVPTTGDVTLPARSAGGTAGAAGRGGTAGRACAPAAGGVPAGDAGRGAAPAGAAGRGVVAVGAGRGAVPPGAAGGGAVPSGAAGRGAVPLTPVEVLLAPATSASSGIFESVTPDFGSSAMPFSFVILDL